LGLGHRFDEVKEMYRTVNGMLGDIIKVTPSSKMVGDLAIFMVQNSLTPENIVERGESLAFPDSVVSYFKGLMGQPPCGFPADLQRVVRHREANKAAYERDGARLTYTPYFIAAAVAVLKAYPQVNASWTEEGLLLHGEINVGIATSLGEEGLIVPVIHRADSYSLLGLARAVADLAGRARSRQLKPDEIKNGTFTITNHGTAGSLFATPVINQPQVGILGVGAIQKRPVVVDEDAIAVRPMVYLSLTFDHRALDGASADAFLSKVVETLENWS
ncbi:MAG TPA: 2-oxo acid dehydrogenase subunit E2, partial [Anaerolineaceae bacterium]|nr:2-oxo acid dehydrogenase subunit E2 [Anaerolineaceae bacterium]